MHRKKAFLKSTHVAIFSCKCEYVSDSCAEFNEIPHVIDEYWYSALRNTIKKKVLPTRYCKAYRKKGWTIGHASFSITRFIIDAFLKISKCLQARLFDSTLQKKSVTTTTGFYANTTTAIKKS